MPTNLNLDDQLIARAMTLGGHRSKREAVNEALRAYVAQLQRMRATEAFGTFDFDPAWDPKRDRQRRSA